MPLPEGFSLGYLDKLVFYSDHFWYGRDRVPYASVSGLYFKTTQTHYKIDGIITGTSYHCELRMLLPKRRILEIKPDSLWFSAHKKEKAEAMAKASRILHDRTFASRIAVYEKRIREKGFAQWSLYKIARNGDVYKKNEFVLNVREKSITNTLTEFSYVISRKFSFKKQFMKALGRSETINISKDRDCFLYYMKHYVGISWPDTPVRERVGQKQKQQEKRSTAIQNTDNDYLKALGLKAGATLKEIKLAYHALARKHHPDVLRANGFSVADIKASEEKLKTINLAYSWLSTHYTQTK